MSILQIGFSKFNTWVGKVVFATVISFQIGGYVLIRQFCKAKLYPFVIRLISVISVPIVFDRMPTNNRYHNSNQLEYIKVY